MEKQITSNIKLGLFVIIGLLILVFSLYMIGRNKSFFGSNFEIKARFKNVNGLMRGNNVRFSGIQAGTVKDIDIINDTTIEVVLLIDTKTKDYIHKNSIASIGSEGLMGNKIINILPNPIPAPAIEEGDMLLTHRELNVDDMLETLDKTNNNVAIISEDLINTVKRFNNSAVIWGLLEDTAVSENIKLSLQNIHQVSSNLNNMSAELNSAVHNISQGKGVLGVLMEDPKAANDLKDAIKQINDVSHSANAIASKLNNLVSATDTNINNGKGVITTLMKDTTIVQQLQNSLDNIEKGTAAFNEDMEALKHNFLLRGYFRKQAKKNKK